MNIIIQYTDGEVIFIHPEQWPTTRADGVDEIRVEHDDGRSNVFSGFSAYWLYREGDCWVMGQAAFGYNETIPPEVVMRPDGAQHVRRIEYVPDLRHEQIKLGWWR